MRKTASMNVPNKGQVWKKAACAACAMALVAGLAGCGSSGDSGAKGEDGQKGEAQEATADTSSESTLDSIDIDGMDFEYTKRDMDGTYDAADAVNVTLAGTSATVDGDGATAEGAGVTIEAAGTYVLTGELTNGQVKVDAGDDDKVQVVLAGASVNNDAGAALFVANADKVFVTLAEGTDNSLTDGASYTQEEGADEPGAAVFSHDDLTLNGSGSLTVVGNNEHGIMSKDDLVIYGGTYDVSAKDDALRGKDSVKIGEGSVSVSAEAGDGVKSNRDDDPVRGFVSIDGGEITIDAGDDGIDAVTYVRVTGGVLDITSGDDAINSDWEALVSGGDITIDAGDDAIHAERVLTIDGGNINVVECVEGYEAEKVYVNGGESNITASDDGVNASAANTTSTQTGMGSDMRSFQGEGDMQGKSQRGMGGESQGDTQTVAFSASGAGNDNGNGNGERGGMRGGMQGGQGGMPDGSQGGTPPELPDGTQDGNMPEAPDGSQDDMGGGMQGGRGNMDDENGGFGGFGGRGGMGGGMGGTMPGATEDCIIQINGGTLTVNAGGDGLDSNGSVEINDGTVYVSGAPSGDNEGLDFEFDATVNGGTVIIVGGTGMGDSVTGGEQQSVQARLNGSAGSEVKVLTSSGEEIASFTSPKAFQTVIVSAPQLQEGQTYTITAGSASTTVTA